jgi:hypothetical protein
MSELTGSPRSMLQLIATESAAPVDALDALDALVRPVIELVRRDWSYAPDYFRFFSFFAAVPICPSW